MGVKITPGVQMLLIATGVAFVIQFIFDVITQGAFTLVFSLSRSGMRNFALWQPVTYMFMHGGLWHILLNMLGLFFFGPETERFMGTKRFLALYFLCGIAAGFGWLIISGSGSAHCLGASGAVFGILGAFAALFPNRPITLLLFFVVPITMRARTMAIGLGLLNLFSMIIVPGNIAYAAHIAGGLAGYGYAWSSLKRGAPPQWWNPMRWFDEICWHWQRRKFKVISSPDDSAEFDVKPSKEEIDRVLDKVAREGIHNLTRQEREILERASKRPW